MPTSALILAIALGTFCAVSGCKGGGASRDAGGSGGFAGSAGSEGGSGDAAGFSRSELLAAFGTCAAEGAKSFRERMASLDRALATLVAAPDPTAREATRQAFRAAMDSWQVMDMMQFGPTASSSVQGGKDFRGNIYAWPTFGRCAVEGTIVASAFESPNFGALLPNRRGLAAVEYLLFYEGADSACPAGSPELAGWMALSPEQRETRMRGYATAAVRDIVTRATALDEAWDPAKGNFVETMRTAGPGNAVYRAPQDAIETVGIALFYLDSVVKDKKLGEPLNDGCKSAACLESPFAGRSKANIRANLDGLRRILEGCQVDHAGLGFDDLLAAVGAGEVATSLRTQVMAAEAALEAISEPDLDQALVQDPASVTALRDAIAEVTTTLKTSFVTVLGFEASRVPTDNDS